VQRAAPDGVAQLALELVAKRQPGVAVDGDEEVEAQVLGTAHGCTFANIDRPEVRTLAESLEGIRRSRYVASVTNSPKQEACRWPFT
jgi:hypothetical protein